MKNILIVLLLSINAIVSSLKAEIIETDRFKKIKEHIQPRTLVLLDIDDTLLVPTQTLGTDAWFVYRLSQYSKVHKDPKTALDKALAEWESIRHVTKVKLVEEDTDQIIKEIQKENTAIMGLTTQSLSLSTRTINQLRSLNIDLSKTAPASEDHYFVQENLGLLYQQGILFTSGTSKGEAVIKMLDKIGYKPDRILFINDKHKHLLDVETSVLARGIPFTGLRYSYSDERVANFCHELAEIQWKHSTFGNLLSDEEALVLLKSKQN